MHKKIVSEAWEGKEGQRESKKGQIGGEKNGPQGMGVAVLHLFENICLGHCNLERKIFSFMKNAHFV